MAKKLPTQQHALYHVLDNILWSEWDPVGVNSIDAARDEYTGYVLPLMDLLLLGCNEQNIAAFLYHCETRTLGVKGCQQKRSHVAKKIFGVTNTLLNHHNAMLSVH